MCYNVIEACLHNIVIMCLLLLTHGNEKGEKVGRGEIWVERSERSRVFLSDVQETRIRHQNTQQQYPFILIGNDGRSEWAVSAVVAAAWYHIFTWARHMHSHNKLFHLKLENHFSQGTTADKLWYWLSNYTNIYLGTWMWPIVIKLYDEKYMG